MSERWRDSYDAWKLATPPEYELTSEQERALEDAAEIERLRQALIDVRELIDGYVDVSWEGTGPNDAMRATQIIDEALKQ